VIPELSSGSKRHVTVWVRAAQRGLSGMLASNMIL